MHFILKMALSVVIVILIASSSYLFILSNEDVKSPIKNENEIENIDDNNSENNNESNLDNESDIIKDFTHYTFIEAGTTVCCKACAQVHIYLDEFYESRKYPFYYISMPIENEKAADHLNSYNIYGYPTVYFDGGYDVIMGTTDWKSIFEEKLISAISRNVPKVLINVTGVWNEETNEIDVNIIIENYEEINYMGRLKVYLSEIISTTWQGDQPYKYAFIDYIINKNIEILPKENNTLSKTIDSSDLDVENLMIFAVIYNSEKHIGYSYPPDKKTFDAYYADAVDATFVVKGGNLPPMVGISNPSIGFVHYFGIAKRTSVSGKTILLGRTSIIADVTDDSSIEKVEFYINGKLMETISEEPFEWRWHRFNIGKKTITVKAYDEMGKSSTATIDVWALMKWKNPLLKLIEMLLK